MPYRPKYFHKGKYWTIEWYSRKNFYITLSIGTFEIEVDKWKDVDRKNV